MLLLDYLNRYFSDQQNLVSLASLMSEKFGIDVKQSTRFPKRFLFKYNQLSADWTKPLTHVCRSVIVERFEQWEVISYPFDKFFNLHEPFCCLTEQQFNDCPSNYQLAEKADGTCIQIYRSDNEVFVSTLGTIETQNVGSLEYTFENLFWDTLKYATGITKEVFCDIVLQEPKRTYVFELCSIHNRIVTRYPKDRIYLLGIRELFDSYRLLTPRECVYWLDNKGISIRLPCTYSGQDFKTITDVRNFVEKEGVSGVSYTEHEVQYPEGYVITQSGKPIAKIKNSKYLTLHSLIGGENERYVARQLVDCFFNETLDDVYEALSDFHIAGIDKLKEEVRFLHTFLHNSVEELTSLLGESSESFDDKNALRKEYAKHVMRLCSTLSGRPQKWISGYLFQNMNLVLQGFAGDFTEALKAMSLRSNNDMDYWKDLLVAEFDKAIKESQNEQD